MAKRLFSWARDQEYGLEVNIFADIKPGSVIGEKVSRDRALNEHEIRDLWIAVNKMPYPYGPAYATLILSGLRLNEAVRARWERDRPKSPNLVHSSRSHEGQEPHS